MAAPRKTPARKPAQPKSAQEPAAPDPARMDAARAEAQRAEAMNPADVVKVVQWRGVDLRIPPSVDDWDIEVQEYAEDGRIVRHLRALLGADQWETLKEQVQPFTMGDAADLSRTIMRDGYGMERGE